jgi:transposase-like protein
MPHTAPTGNGIAPVCAISILRKVLPSACGRERPRIYECHGCGHQESVTAGTIFHRTRTDLPKWFLAAYLMGRDKRGVSATFLQRELDDPRVT